MHQENLRNCLADGALTTRSNEHCSFPIWQNQNPEGHSYVGFSFPQRDQGPTLQPCKRAGLGNHQPKQSTPSSAKGLKVFAQEGAVN